MIDEKLEICSDNFGFNFFDGKQPLPGKPVLSNENHSPASPLSAANAARQSQDGIVIPDQEQEQQQQQLHTAIGIVNSNDSSSSIANPLLSTFHEHEQYHATIAEEIDSNSSPFPSYMPPALAVSYIVNYRKMVWEKIINPYSEQGCTGFMEFFGGEIGSDHFFKNSLQKMKTGLCIDMIGSFGS